ncbi:MAG: thioredoxin family protein [Bacteroidia bacterium]
MKSYLWKLVCLLFLAMGVGFIFPAKKVKDFRLKNIDGKYISLRDYPEAKGFMVVFTCNHCPFANLYPPRMNALYDKYLPLGVPLIAISSTDTVIYENDTFAEMQQKAMAEGFRFPYLIDETQAVAKEFHAQKTPHAFLIWKENEDWVIKYSGAIDDNGAHPDEVETSYLENATDAMLQGKEIEIKETKSIGCQIYYRKK